MRIHYQNIVKKEDVSQWHLTVLLLFVRRNVSIPIIVTLSKQSEYFQNFEMKIVRFFVGDVFAARFLSVFTNSTINEHHAIEFDWSKTGEENFMEISKMRLKIVRKPHDETSFIVLIHEFSLISVLLNR